MKQGFSLVELSIILLILAFILTSSLTFSTTDVQQDNLEATSSELEDIKAALKIFVNENGRLPCPARLDVDYTSAEFGREATDCADASPPAGVVYTESVARPGSFVRTGGVPFYALGLTRDYLADAWNNKYLYAVTNDFITAVTSADQGVITVRDEVASPSEESQDIAFVLLSGGATGRGMTGAKSTAVGLCGGVDTPACSGIRVCNTADRDGQNCKGDSQFVFDVYQNAPGSAIYDDIMVWASVSELFGGTTTACDGGTADVSASYGGKCYAYFFSGPGETWPNAEAACVAWGGHLVSEKSDAERDFILKLISSLGSAGRFWIGLNDRVSEGTFVWVADGSTPTYTNWDPSEANAYDCTQHSYTASPTTDQLWTTDDCANIKPYMCFK